MEAFKQWVGRLLHRLLPKPLADFYDRHSQGFWYLFFGALTTGVNFVVYWILTREVFATAFAQRPEITAIYANWMAWFCAVLFAFTVNRCFVFDCRVTGGAFYWQFASFFAMRLASGVLENTLPSLMIAYLHMHDLVAKVAVAVLIIVLNYLFAKFVSFRRNKAGDCPPCAEREETKRP
ncbi:MAG: GtrA family protein [Eubacteriales bacterium]